MTEQSDETAEVTGDGYTRVRCSRCALDQYYPCGPGGSVSSEAVVKMDWHAKGYCEPLEEDPTCLFCGESVADHSALTHLHIVGERLGEPGGPAEPSAYLRVGPTGFIHAHGWHMYAPTEDRLSRHLGRSVRRRLPVRILRAEMMLRRKVLDLRTRKSENPTPPEGSTS